MRHVILLPFIMIMIMAGCAAVGPDHTMDLDAKELERQDGLKNLAAIREIMASWPRQQDQPASPTSKPDEYHGNDSPWVIPQVYETDKPVEPLSLFAIPKQEPVQPQPLQIRPPLRSPELHRLPRAESTIDPTLHLLCTDRLCLSRFHPLHARLSRRFPLLGSSLKSNLTDGHRF